MAAINERLSYAIDHTPSDGIPMRTVPFVSSMDALMDAARAIARQGDTDVSVVTVHITWRGKHGKRTYQDIQRQPIHA